MRKCFIIVRKVKTKGLNESFMKADDVLKRHKVLINMGQCEISSHLMTPLSVIDRVSVICFIHDTYI